MDVREDVNPNNEVACSEEGANPTPCVRDTGSTGKLAPKRRMLKRGLTVGSDERSPVARVITFASWTAAQAPFMVARDAWSWSF